MSIKIIDVMNASGVQFGTSGVRGLVKDMTDKVCFIYVSAFLQHLSTSKLVTSDKRVGIAGDLRQSSPRIMNAVAAACEVMGFEPINYGDIPSPAVAAYGFKGQFPTIMVTGSHIPDDRNGIKFNTPFGEILKQDEQAIRAEVVSVSSSLFDEAEMLLRDDYLPQKNGDATRSYIARYLDFFEKGCLSGINIGLYEHSSVARDVFKTVLEQLGAEVTSLARSTKFISVDTEAIRPEDVVLAKEWCAEGKFDCIISTDGDGDRPLISDQYGTWLRGDVAGVLCAHYLNADIVITPVSSNTVVDKSGYFGIVERTKIGSPYVIEAMQNQEKNNKGKSVVGYEANGGFLQQVTITRENVSLAPLATRDAIIVPLTVILAAKKAQGTIADLVKSLPERYTASDRLKNFPTEISKSLLSSLNTGNIPEDLSKIGELFPDFAKPIAINTTDGVRITLENEDVVHLRPSGNAPEFRCYAESTSVETATQLCEKALEIIESLKDA
jgi:phosphomannomutase